MTSAEVVDYLRPLLAEQRRYEVIRAQLSLLLHYYSIVSDYSDNDSR